VASPTPTATSSEEQPRRTTKRAQQKAETRARLLAAARSVFGDGSVVTTPLDVVAASAGVSKATLFFHFSDRAELLQGVAVELYFEMGKVLEETLAQGSGTLRDAMAAYLDAQRDPRAQLLWHVGETLDAMGHPLGDVAYEMIRSEVERLALAAGADAERAGHLVAVLAPAALLMARRIAGGKAEEAEEERFLTAVEALAAA
jgi:AcrR family transcriptional regulator